jgi:type II secretory pathway component GspD/PulD (secretin)
MLLALVMTLGVWGADTQGSMPDGDPAAQGTRPAPPVHPSRYVEAVVKLCGNGKPADAAPYFKAAEDYADMLSPQDRALLDQYRALVTSAAGSAPADPAVAPAATQPAPTPSASMPAPAPMGGRGTEADNKTAARWILQQAREDIRLGRYDEAQVKIDRVRAMNVNWSLFDDTPNKVAEVLEKAKPRQAANSAAAMATTARDKNAAKESLKQARAALATGEFDKAESIALEVKSWGLHFGMLEDSPEKIASAARSLRKRDSIRKGGTQAQPNEDLYQIQIAEARRLLGEGKFDEAEARAQQAQRLGVIPPVTADRAENILAEIAAARAGASVINVAQNTADPNVRRVQDALAGDPAPIPLEAAAPPELAPASAPQPVDPLQGVPAQDEPLDPPLGEPADQAPGTATVGTAGPLDQARALFQSGNFPAAVRAANDAKAADPSIAAAADDLIAQINLAQQNGALAIYEAAVAAIRKGDLERARALLNELAAQNLDDSMQQKVQDLLLKIPSQAELGQGKQPKLGSIEDAETVAAQKLNAEVGTRVAEARRLLETDPDKAIALLQATAAQVKASGLPDSVTKTMSRRLEVAVELAKKDKVAFEIKMKDKAFREEIERKRLRILEADKAKQERLATLLDKAKEADAAGNFAESEKFYKMALEIDPNELAAVAGAQVARVKRHYNRDQEIRAGKDETVLNAFQEVDAAGIASLDLQRNGIEYREGFKALTESRRNLAARLQPPKSPKAQQIEAKLSEPISINADKQSLGDTLDYIANFTGLNIVTDPAALAEEGLTLKSPVDLKLNGVKLRQALQYLLKPLNLTYVVDDEVLLITSPQGSRAKTVVRLYNVADLVMPPANRSNGQSNNPAPTTSPGGLLTDPNNALGIVNPTLSTLGAPNVATNGGNMGVSVGSAMNTEPTVSVKDPATIDFEPLINLIKSSIAPGTWNVSSMPADAMSSMAVGQGAAFGAGGDLAGGADQAIGQITPFFLNISLIIRHTAEVHDEIVDLLRQLRRLQDLQVSVEVRFITITDSFFEQIGVDFDFAIQSDAIGRHASLAAPVAGAGNRFGEGTTAGGGGVGGTTGITNPYVFNPIRDHALPATEPVVVGRQSNGGIGNFTPNLQIPFLQGSADSITPFNALATNTGATFGIAFLSDLETYFFLTAVQGDQRNNLVQAPKVTTFNGASATINNFINRFYVATLVPIVGAGSVAFQPGIGAIPDGVILNVTPVVSADRRYVRMTLSPFFQTFIEFQTFTIPAAVGGGGLGGQASTINAQVQLPVTQVTNILTTVTVPDGGTVLLGGVKRQREQRNEFGVPVLSKTPLINRLFRNIGIGRTTDSLMLMVTPRIIILEEEEEKLGIPQVQNATF